MKLLGLLTTLAFALAGSAATATDYPAPKQGDWIACFKSEQLDL